jgi:hypothetical protein
MPALYKQADLQPASSAVGHTLMPSTVSAGAMYIIAVRYSPPLSDLIVLAFEPIESNFMVVSFFELFS